jgi:hypothetical protein
MNIKSITEIFKHISSSHVKTRLGRWNNHNHEETIIKIKYATEDNCGFSYHNYKNTTKIQQNNQLEDDKNYIYVMGYESVH